LEAIVLKVLTILAVIFIAMACAQPGGLNFREPGVVKPAGKTPSPAPTVKPGFDPWFARLHSTIIQPKCLCCHQPPKPNAKVDLSDYETIMGLEGLVVKGDPESSGLYFVISEKVMPPRPNDPLNSAEVDAIYKWIKAGAPKEVPIENPDSTPLPTPLPTPVSM
jgi:hypothetical protein